LETPPGQDAIRVIGLFGALVATSPLRDVPAPEAAAINGVGASQAVAAAAATIRISWGLMAASPSAAARPAA
jgi:hypothetical protein